MCSEEKQDQGRGHREFYRRGGFHFMLDGQGSVTDKILFKQRPERPE